MAKDVSVFSCEVPPILACSTIFPDTFSFEIANTGGGLYVSSRPSEHFIEAAAKRAYERSRKCPTLRDLGPWDELKGLYRSDWFAIVRATLDPSTDG